MSPGSRQELRNGYAVEILADEQWNCVWEWGIERPEKQWRPKKGHEIFKGKERRSPSSGNAGYAPGDRV